MIDEKSFYQKIRDVKLFDKLTKEQVNCIDILIEEWEKAGIDDLRQFAYLLATVYHETAFTMLPIKERGSEAYLRSKRYFPFVGLGLIQLTWKSNYEKFGKLLKIDLVNNPELALEPHIAAKIAVIGMVKGLFTGVGLSKFFNSVKEDWIQARKIINGLDRAEQIAKYAKKFLFALS